MANTKKEEEKSLEKEILRFEQVTGRGRKFPIQNVDFTMKSGYIYGLTGRNGAGKSTLIKTILHEQSRYKGAIYVDGIPVKENYAAACRKIGYVSEDNVFLKNVRQCKMQKRWAFFMMISR